jgi:hypothetical protein
MTEKSKSNTRVIRANFHHALGNGQQFHTHFLIASRETRESLPESESPLWQALTHEGGVFAVAVARLFQEHGRDDRYRAGHGSFRLPSPPEVPFPLV